MPDRDGLETILAMRQLLPKSPVIAISGGHRDFSKDLLLIAKRLGAARIFEKPVDLPLLARTIRDMLAANAAA